MGPVQNYHVEYRIDVDAATGVKQITQFGEAIGNLVRANSNFKLAVANIKSMMQEVDEVFRPKGKKRNYTYDFNIRTSQTEEKLARVKNALTEIKGLTQGITLVINAGQKLDTKGLKAQTKKVVNQTISKPQASSAQKTAKDSYKSISEAQKGITKVIGKLNGGLISLEKGRTVNIQTNTAKERLQEILNLMTRVKNLSKTSLAISMTPAANDGKGTMMAMGTGYPVGGNLLGNKLWEKQQKRIKKISESRLMKEIERQQELEYRQNIRKKLDAFKKYDEESARREKAYAKKKEALEYIRVSNLLKQENAERARKAKRDREAASVARRQARETVNIAQKQYFTGETMHGNKRRAAINRIQYSKTPSMRNLPVLSMFNTYMAYSFMKSQLRDAVEYNNVMESAKSILRVADSDLGTFEQRFEKMSKHVRQIGVDTKFTAVEIAQATKYLAMAGMDIDTIHQSMRPITDLSLIGDNDVGLVADLATNIMSGYKIKNTSMQAVADVLASTASRSNVNIIEMSESFKMASGYLKMAGIDFTEAAAAIGILGNSGIKGTMAGTALRAMSTRFAKPTKEAVETLDKLKVKFTQFIDVYGKKVEKVRPLAEIFEDLHKAGATMADMQTIFGKIGGNAAMQFINNYEELKRLTTQNKGSNGIANELALIKQQTTKGLWDQVTSQLSESFMVGFELVEPTIRQNLKEFLERFNTPELSRGLADISRTLINIVSALAQLGTWVIKNFSWIEPIVFSGFVATRLYKLAGALTNVGVAVGFIGKQSAAASTIQFLTGLTGMGGKINGKGLTFANKRAIVKALQSSGVTGKGAMTRSLLSSGLLRGSSVMSARSAFAPLFSSQVATGSGMVGATASLSAIGTGAAVATASVSALVGALGWVAYKTWKIKEAKDAVQEEIKANRKYRYPSIDSLYNSLRKTYQQALDTKGAVDEVTKGKSIEEASGQTIGALTGNWWVAFMSNFAAAETRSAPAYSFEDAYQEDVKNAIHTLAEKDSQNRMLKAYSDLGKLKDDLEIGGFIRSVKTNYGQDEKNLKDSLWTEDKQGNVLYKKGMDKLTAAEVVNTKGYADYMNKVLVPEIVKIAGEYRKSISSQEEAILAMTEGGFNFEEFTKLGYYRDEKSGEWTQRGPDKKATKEEKETAFGNEKTAHFLVSTFMGKLRSTYGGSAEIAENILKKAGFTPKLYSNEPDKNDFLLDDNNITNEADDGLAGGNYSGTGKLSSAAPKQVIVHIGNLLSLEAINLLKSEEGKSPEILNLKEQLAQALIDVVHDFDASWSG